MAKKIVIIIFFGFVFSLVAWASHSGETFQVDNDTTLEASLISYYQLENANDFFDSQNLTVSGTVPFQTGKVSNGAFASSSASNHLTGAATYFNFPGTAAFSCAGWIYPYDATLNNAVINKWSDPNVPAGWGAWLNTSGLVILRLANNTDVSNRIAKTATDNAFISNAWQWLAITYDGSKTAAGFKAYRNSTSAIAFTVNADTLTNNTSNTMTFRLGADEGGTATWGGGHDEWACWNKVLSSQELTDLYNGTGTGLGQTMVAAATAPVRRRTSTTILTE